MKKFIKPLAFLVLSALVATPTVHALPLLLDPPSSNWEALERDGTLRVVDDLREADFGGGLRLPIRWVYRSSDQSSTNPYGWAGFNLTVLESRAVKKTSVLFEVTMLSGEVAYFSKGTDGIWKSNDTQWTGVEDANKFTMTRWDGWEVEFRDGLMYSLKTEENRTLRWEYDSTDPSLVTRVYEPSTNATTISVGLSSVDLHMVGSSTLRGAHTLTVNGDTYTFTYSGGTLQDIAFPDGRKTQWKFEPVGGTGNRLTLTQESGWWRSWAFGAEDRLLKTDDIWSYSIIAGAVPVDGVVYNRPTMERIRIATGESERIEYTGSNSIRTVKDVLGNETATYSYKTSGKLYDKIFKSEKKKMGESAATVIWRGVYDSVSGDLISSFDALDKQTSYSYERFAGGNEFLPPKKVTITDPMGRTRSIERDLQGNIIELVGTAGVKRKIEYDSRHRLTRVMNAANDVLLRFVYGDKDQILESYDALANKTTYEYTLFLGEPLLTKTTTPEGHVTEISRDTKGRVTKIKTPSTAEWNYAYVGDWSVTQTITDPMAAETSFEYDTRLNEIKVTDPLNRITQTVYDDLDLPMEVTDALSQKTKFENNGNRDLKKLTDARNNAYNLAWEEDGVRKSLEWPDADKQTNVFDANGKLSQWKAKANAGIVNILRNDAGEITGRTWTAGTESGNATLTRNAFGQVTGTSATTMGLAVNQALSYNSEGQLSSLGQTVGGITRTAGVTYDLDGRVATITYPAGFTVTYEYNKDGQAKTIKTGTTTIASYSYDTAGRLATRTLSSGVVTSYAYDAANRLASITVTNGSNVLWVEHYGYNASGERIYTLQGTSGTVGDAYGLDATSQLRGVKYGSADAILPYAAQSGQTAFQWQYDAVGNRIEETGSGGTTTYVANNTNQYTSVSSLSAVAYSARGDLTQSGDWAYSYDARGNLMRAQNSQTNATSKYWRDAFGRRAVKDVNGSKTIFFNLGTNQLEIYDATNATGSSTIHEPGIDRPLAEVSSSGALTFYHQDWLGSVALLTDASGAKLQTFTYDVWGKPSGFDTLGSSLLVSSFASRFLYTAREYETETALYHYRARAYSPALGRFLQADPIDFRGGDINVFRYVRNNCVNWSDPSGKCLPLLWPILTAPEWLPWAIAGLAGVTAAPLVANALENAQSHDHNDPDDQEYKPTNRDKKQDDAPPKKRGPENDPPPPSDPTGKRDVDRERQHREKSQDGRGPADNYGGEGRRPN